MRKEYGNIRIEKKVKKDLTRLKYKKESYTGVIKRLIKEWKQKRSSKEL